MARKFRMEFCLGFNFGPRIFWVLFEALGIFFYRFDHPCDLKSEVPRPPPARDPSQPDFLDNVVIAFLYSFFPLLLCLHLCYSILLTWLAPPASMVILGSQYSKFFSVDFHCCNFLLGKREYKCCCYCCSANDTSHF